MKRVHFVIPIASVLVRRSLSNVSRALPQGGIYFGFARNPSHNFETSYSQIRPGSCLAFLVDGDEQLFEERLARWPSFLFVGSCSRRTQRLLTNRWCIAETFGVTGTSAHPSIVFVHTQVGSALEDLNILGWLKQIRCKVMGVCAVLRSLSFLNNHWSGSSLRFIDPVRFDFWSSFLNFPFYSNRCAGCDSNYFVACSGPKLFELFWCVRFVPDSHTIPIQSRFGPSETADDVRNQERCESERHRNESTGT